MEEIFRPSIAEIDLDALRHNYLSLKNFANGSELMPILKANGYGHGLIACARELESLKPWGIGVAFLEEAVALRKAGIGLPIFALGGISGRQLGDFLKFDIDFCASSIMKLEAINQAAKAVGKKARVHLKIDTGMERVGVHYYSCQSLLENSLTHKNIEVVSLFSHFADAENQDLSFSKLQLERFLEAASFYEKHSLPKPKLHIANSPAILGFKESHLNVIRPGLSLFGVSPAPHLANVLDLKPVLRLTTEVVYFKVVKEGSSVSYGRTWTAKEQTRVITVPVGYGDGYPRELSNKASILVRGKSYPVVGKVCMDQFMVNLGPNGEAYNGDEVVIVGEQGQEKITIEELATLANTDPRDILLRLALRIPKRFKKDGKEFIVGVYY